MRHERAVGSSRRRSFHEADDRASIFKIARIVGLQMQVERRQRLGRPEPEPSAGARIRLASFGSNHRSRSLDRRIGFQRSRSVQQPVAQDRVAPMRLLDEQLAAGVRRQPLERTPHFVIFYPP